MYDADKQDKIDEYKNCIARLRNGYHFWQFRAAVADWKLMLNVHTVFGEGFKLEDVGSSDDEINALSRRDTSIVCAAINECAKDFIRDLAHKEAEINR